MSRLRWPAFAIVSSGLLAFASTSAAEPSGQAACIQAYTEGQELDRTGALGGAKERFLVCAREPCSKVLMQDCVRWLEDVNRKIPSVVFEARAADGTDLSDVRVFVDGVLLVSRLSGRPIEMDPGEHALRFELAGAAPIERRFVAYEGRKAHSVVVTFPGVSAASGDSKNARPAAGANFAAERSTSKPPPLAYVLGGIGVVALGGFAYLGVRGISDRSDLASCKGSCPRARVDDARRELLAADISLGIAVVAIGVAGYLWLASSSSSSK